MEIKMSFGKLDFDPNPHKTTTNNFDYHKVLFVEFPNCVSTKTGRSFKWVPSYAQLEEIREKLDEVEKLNRELLHAQTNCSKCGRLIIEKGYDILKLGGEQEKICEKCFMER